MLMVIAINPDPSSIQVLENGNLETYMSYQEADFEVAYLPQNQLIMHVAEVIFETKVIGIKIPRESLSLFGLQFNAEIFRLVEVPLQEHVENAFRNFLVTRNFYTSFDEWISLFKIQKNDHEPEKHNENAHMLLADEINDTEYFNSLNEDQLIKISLDGMQMLGRQFNLLEEIQQEKASSFFRNPAEYIS
jgi:hypothetical protein